MLKPYREEFTKDLLYRTQVHPSTKQFAHFTKNIDATFGFTGLFLISLCIYNIFFATFFTAWLALMGIVWFFYLIFTRVKSPYLVRKEYNEYIFPIEVAFNQMEYRDQKKYKDMLAKSYKICARRDMDEYDELKKIRELFELKIPAKNKVLSVDEELEVLRKEAQEKEDHDKRMQIIVDELNRNSGL